MNLRTVLLVGATVAVGGTLVLLAQPSLAQYISVDTILIGGIGAGMTLLGIARIQRARATEHIEASTDNPDRVLEVAVPGGEVDEQLAAYHRPHMEYHSALETLEDRLTETLRISIMRQRACSRAEADAIIAAGEWTDDPVAAAYLGDEVTMPEAVRDRVREQLTPKQLKRDRLARTIEAVASFAGIEETGTDQ